MEKLQFWKLHGSGNDFVCLNGFQPLPSLSPKQIAWICHRRLGVGADGLIVIEPTENASFRMVYYNADGFEGSMCGNGGRTAAVFARMLGVRQTDNSFVAYDGIHNYIIHRQDDEETDVELTMNDVRHIEMVDGGLIVNTGSPHLVLFTDNLSTQDVVGEGRKIRYSKLFAPEGINVNFLESNEKGNFLRTYERGVEDETLSCGTGVTAAAIALNLKNGNEKQTIRTRGGVLNVDLQRKGDYFTGIRLRGPVRFVFTGTFQGIIPELWEI